MAPIQQSLADFEVMRVLGKGSFGRALLVRHRLKGIKSVLKEVKIAAMSQKEKEEANKECDVLRRMCHPNICSFRSSFLDRGKLYIEMDYCDGGDLAKVLERQDKSRPLDEKRVLDWFVQLCMALDHVHSKKVLHRDIKAQNVFLTRGGMIKLGDFGISRVLVSTLEQASTAVGTPFYLSPEIARGRKYNAKTDVWSLGVLLYELLTFRHPFNGVSIDALIRKILAGRYAPVSTFYSHEVRQLVKDMLELNPQRRPSIKDILRKPFIQARLLELVARHDELSDVSLGAGGNKDKGGANQRRGGGGARASPFGGGQQRRAGASPSGIPVPSAQGAYGKAAERARGAAAAGAAAGERQAGTPLNAAERRRRAARARGFGVIDPTADPKPTGTPKHDYVVRGGAAQQKRFDKGLQELQDMYRERRRCKEDVGGAGVDPTRPAAGKRTPRGRADGGGVAAALGDPVLDVDELLSKVGEKEVAGKPKNQGGARQKKQEGDKLEFDYDAHRREREEARRGYYERMGLNDPRPNQSPVSGAAGGGGGGGGAAGGGVAAAGVRPAGVDNKVRAAQKQRELAMEEAAAKRERRRLAKERQAEQDREREDLLKRRREEHEKKRQQQKEEQEKLQADARVRLEKARQGGGKDRESLLDKIRRDEASHVARMEAEAREREERRLARQREFEARRVARAQKHRMYHDGERGEFAQHREKMRKEQKAGGDDFFVDIAVPSRPTRRRRYASGAPEKHAQANGDIVCDDVSDDENETVELPKAHAGGVVKPAGDANADKVTAKGANAPSGANGAKADGAGDDKPAVEPSNAPKDGGAQDAVYDVDSSEEDEEDKEDKEEEAAQDYADMLEVMLTTLLVDSKGPSQALGKDVKGADIVQKAGDDAQGANGDGNDGPPKTDDTDLAVDEWGGRLHADTEDDGEPLGQRIDSLREFLEEKIGMDAFMDAYAVAQEDGDFVVALKKYEAESCAPLLVQLLHCEAIAFGN